MATAGVNDGDMLQLLPQQQQQGGQQQQQPGQDSNPMAFNDDGSSKNPAALMAALRGDPRQLSAIEESNPPLAKYAINMRVGILHACNGMLIPLPLTGPSERKMSRPCRAACEPCTSTYGFNLCRCHTRGVHLTDALMPV